MLDRLLRNSLPLVIDPQLATAVGLNEAIVIQQINYWLKINERDKHSFRDGYYWTYNSIIEWQTQFPFWSVHTVRRIFEDLEAKGFLIVGNFNKMAIDRTKWYRLDYEKLDTIPVPQLVKPIDENLLLPFGNNASPYVQNGLMGDLAGNLESTKREVPVSDLSKMDNPFVQVGHTNNQRLTSETNSKIKSKREIESNVTSSSKLKKILNLKKIAIRESLRYFDVDVDNRAIATQIGIKIKKYGADKILTFLQTAKGLGLSGDSLLSACWQSLAQDKGNQTDSTIT